MEFIKGAVNARDKFVASVLCNSPLAIMPQVTSPPSGRSITWGSDAFFVLPLGVSLSLVCRGSGRACAPYNSQQSIITVPQRTIVCNSVFH